jgi:hypothetical protein
VGGLSIADVASTANGLFPEKEMNTKLINTDGLL